MNPFEPFSLNLPAVVRPCRETDLPTLEWFGLFSASLIRAQFDRQLKGEALILVADVNSVASGQVWIDFSRLEADATGVLWAVRVFPCLQSLGIGRRLILGAEYVLVSRGFLHAELDVHHENQGAQRLYYRLGYSAAPDVSHAPGLHLRLRKDLSTLPAIERLVS